MTAKRFTALPLSLLLGAALLTGCMRTAKPVPAPQPVVATAEKIAAYRESVDKLRPGSMVGIVAASQPEYNLVAVGDLPVQSFKVGQTLSFVDSDGNTIGNGQIKNIVNDLLILKYDSLGKRAPEKGDLALWLKE